MRYIIIIFVTTCVFAACSEDKFTTYDSTRYLYFAKGITADSITESFFFYPDETTHDIRLELLFAGGPVTENMTYRIEVDESLTTAVEERISISNPRGYGRQARNVIRLC